MRSTICAATFVILLLIGFLATPGLFKVVNPEYLLALREYGHPLAQLAQGMAELDERTARIQPLLSKLDRDKKALALELSTKQAELIAKSAPDAEIKTLSIEFTKKIESISIEMDQFHAELKQVQERKTDIEGSQAELRKKLDVSAADSTNIHVVARALALGAIGAMMSVFAKHLATPSKRSLFEDKASMGRMWVSMAMGSIVSVIVVGLFFTGFISIFVSGTQNTGETDFWKVTILCLLAGAFSDRLFETAASRMEQYLQTGSSTSKDAENSKVAEGAN